MILFFLYFTNQIISINIKLRILFIKIFRLNQQKILNFLNFKLYSYMTMINMIFDIKQDGN